MDLDVNSHLFNSRSAKSASRASRHALLLLEKKVTASTPPHPSRPSRHCPLGQGSRPPPAQGEGLFCIWLPVDVS